MNATKIYNPNGKDFKEILLELIESELVIKVNQKYNSGKDIAAIEEEEK